MVLSLIEPDLNLDSGVAETYTLDLIKWDSDAATTSMGENGIEGAYGAFNPEPSTFKETGLSTGIFQSVVEIPKALGDKALKRGEEIVLTYSDWDPVGADYVGQNNEDIGLTIYTSSVGAEIELDQKVYSWTDKVYITIVAPEYNWIVL